MPVSEMQAATPPPEDLGVEFLKWLRRETERSWRCFDEKAEAGVGARWRLGSQWTRGLEDTALAEVERHFNVRLTPDHRLFLQTPHSTTPWMRGYRYGGQARPVLDEALGFTAG